MPTVRRRSVLLLVVAVLAACGVGGGMLALARAVPVHSYITQPGLRPPELEVSHSAARAGDGYVFVAPKPLEVGSDAIQEGPMIVNNQGEVVWFRPLRAADANDFRVQRYRGEKVLTWWQGRVVHGYGVGSYVIMNDRYQPVARVRPGRGYDHADLHEFVITPRNTALFLIYDPVRWTDPRTSTQRRVIDGVIQEVDIATGKVVFEWHSLGHIGLDESYGDFTRDGIVDYLHPNSIEIAPDGNLLLSARHTSAVYKINRRTGEVLWRLGGKESDFAMKPGAAFAYQHDVHAFPGGRVTIFDNGAYPAASPHPRSRGITLKLHMNSMAASLTHEYTHPDGLLADSQGNMQTLPGGHVFIGWGSEPAYTEYTAAGAMIYDVRFPSRVMSYRAFRFRWQARPTTHPAIAVEPADGHKVTVYASWNGATDIARWQVLAGPSRHRLAPTAAAAKTGFETPITFRADANYVAVRALDASGHPLGMSDRRKLTSMNPTQASYGMDWPT